MFKKVLYTCLEYVENGGPKLFTKIRSGDELAQTYDFLMI